MTKQEILNIDTQTQKGQAIYNKAVLKIYDLWVLGFSNKFLWKCKTINLERHFSKHLSHNHLDVGVGTGYFLKKCLKKETKRIALFDLNENSLNSAASKIKKYSPEKYRVNILEKIDLECENFDSISINFLLHCLPNSIKEKAVVFKHLRKYLNTGGIIFGSTILNHNIKKNFLAKKLMEKYNQKGIFDNREDSLEELEIELNRYFDNVEIEVIGCVAIFKAQKIR